MLSSRLALIILTVVLVSACFVESDSDTVASPPAANQNISDIGDAAIADEEQGSDWLAYGRTHNERRYSPLKTINAENVSELGVDWYVDLPRDNGLVSTPLVVNGKLYFIGAMNFVKSLDAASGELLWEFDPEVAKAKAGRRPAGWSHSRGISFYEGKIFVATWDGRLIAVEADSGRQLWSTQTTDIHKPLFLTGAPKAFKGKVLIGNGGTENGPTRGYITAYDANSGEQAWRFYIVPGNPDDGFENEAMAMAAETWTGEWWKHGGGGNVWHGYTYDAELDVLYVGTGNGSPWNRKIRSPGGGDNLFLASILALNPDTGEYLWHYQTTPGESWDFNSNMDIVLADLEIEGKPVKAILHAPKNGFFYVINRETGKLLSAEPFTKTTWATHVDIDSGRPAIVAGARYESGRALVAPNGSGAHNWHAMSYNPDTGYAYIPTNHAGSIYTDVNYDLRNWQSEDFFGGTGVDQMPPDSPVSEFPGSLQAWDPVANKRVWQVPQDTPANPGTLTTAGNLVFQGRSNGLFIAYDAENGEKLWTFDTGLGISAPPITYAVEGKQYVSLLVGFGAGFSGLGGSRVAGLGWSYGRHTRRLVTFSLQGSKELPAQPPPFVPVPLAAEDFEVDVSLATIGKRQWKTRCFTCHGPRAIAGGMAPDLRASSIPLSDVAFAAIVREGVSLGNGMPGFPNISDDELASLRHYIRQQANDTR